jgi:REP element-mobilizing transposase RayT
MLLPDNVYFITNRCIQQQFLLKPGKNINRIIGAWLARALKRYGSGITIYGFIFMSNHFHMLIRDKKGQLPKFMWYFQTNMSKAINRELGRRGKIFENRYDAAVVADDESFLTLYMYILGNGVKACLVEKAGQWPGLSSYEATITGEKLRFRQLDATRYLRACIAKGKKRVKKEDYTVTYELPVTVPECIADENHQKEVEKIEEMVKAFEHKQALKRKAEGKKVSGVKKILAGKPTDRPANPSFSAKVIIFCANLLTKKEYMETLGNFTASYREASEGFKKAAIKKRTSNTEWPEFSCPPTSLIPIGYEKTG